MDPLTIAALAISIGLKASEAYQRHQAASATLAAMLKEKRGPTAEEWKLLRDAGAEADADLDALLA